MTELDPNPDQGGEQHGCHGGRADHIPAHFRLRAIAKMPDQVANADR